MLIAVTLSLNFQCYIQWARSNSNITRKWISKFITDLQNNKHSSSVMHKECKWENSQSTGTWQINVIV